MQRSYTLPYRVHAHVFDTQSECTHTNRLCAPCSLDVLSIHEAMTACVAKGYFQSEALLQVQC